MDNNDRRASSPAPVEPSNDLTIALTVRQVAAVAAIVAVVLVVLIQGRRWRAR